MLSQFLIYGLVPLGSGHAVSDVRYVGKSCSGLKRPEQHGGQRNINKHPTFPVVKWIQKLRREGADYSAIVLEEAGMKDDLPLMEKFWISQLRGVDLRLLNVAPGGEGGVTCAGIPKSAEHRKKLSIARSGQKVSEEAKRKISKALTGRPDWMPPGFREKQAASMKGNSLGRLNKGVPKSQEHKDKISAAHIGKPMHPNTLAAILKANTGRKHTAETRVRMSIAQKLRFQKTDGGATTPSGDIENAFVGPPAQ